MVNKFVSILHLLDENYLFWFYKIDFNFYPNPSNGLFNITLNENAIVTITDLTGKICYKNNLNKGVHIIELIGFSKGNYILNVNEKAEKLLLQ